MTPLALGAFTASLTLLAMPVATGAAPISSTHRVVGTLSGGTWPLQPPTVVTDFDDPLPYASGHRGIDLAAAVGQVVVAAGAGTVTTAGQVAGRPVVVVSHANDLRTTYLPVTPLVTVGSHVQAGEPIGLVSSHGHCTSTTCLHWGARHRDQYIDPRTLLPLRAGPIVLLPVDP